MCLEDCAAFTYLEPHESRTHVAIIKVKFNIINLSLRRFLVIILNPLVYFYVGRQIVDNIYGEFDGKVSIYECFKKSHGYQWRTEGGIWGVQTPSEIPKNFQNRAKLNPIVKTVKNC